MRCRMSARSASAGTRPGNASSARANASSADTSRPRASSPSPVIASVSRNVGCASRNAAISSSDARSNVRRVNESAASSGWRRHHVSRSRPGCTPRRRTLAVLEPDDGVRADQRQQQHRVPGVRLGQRLQRTATLAKSRQVRRLDVGNDAERLCPPPPWHHSEDVAGRRAILRLPRAARAAPARPDSRQETAPAGARVPPGGRRRGTRAARPSHRRPRRAPPRIRATRVPGSGSSLRPPMRRRPAVATATRRRPPHGPCATRTRHSRRSRTRASHALTRRRPPGASPCTVIARRDADARTAGGMMVATTTAGS